MINRRKISIATIVVFILVVIVSTFLSVVGIIGYTIYSNQQWKELNSLNVLLAEQSATGLSHPMWNFDRHQIRLAAESVMSQQAVYAVVIYQTAPREVFQSLIRNSDWKIVVSDNEPNPEGLLMHEELIPPVNENLGSVKIFITPKFLEQKLENIRMMIIVSILVVTIILILTLYLLLRRLVLRPLKLLESYAIIMSKENIGKASFPTMNFFGELSTLSFSITTMITMLESRYMELQKETKLANENEKRFRTLLQIIPDLVWLKDPFGVYLLCNSKFEQLYGAKEEDIIGKTDYDFVDREQADFFRMNDKKAAETGKPNTNEEWLTFANNGNRSLMETIKVPMYDLESNLVGVLGITRDITERKQSEENLKNSETKYRFLTEKMKDVVWIMDTNTMSFTYISPSVLSLRGYTPEEIISVPIEMTFTPETKTFFLNTIRERVSEFSAGKDIPAGFHTDEIEQPCKDGSTVWTEVTTKLFLNEKTGHIEIHGVTHDIAERKRAEKELIESNKQLERTMVRLEETQRQVSQQERLRSLGQMASGICHDINNSLTPIMGYADLLLTDKDLKNRKEKELNRIIQSTKNISKTIGRLREFYKIKVTDDDFKAKNINDIISNTIELTSHRWKDIAESTGSAIEMKTKFQFDIPLTKIDESELTEALTNIILNACDAMPNGGSLTFTTYQSDNNIIVEAKDTGKGMDAETLKRCIDPFFTTKGDKGTGLGLSMVFGVIDRHNGEIKIESEKNAGTTVRISLPLKMIKINEKVSKEAASFLKPLKILSVEDDETISDIISQMLTKNNHKVETCTNGKLGLDLYIQEMKNNEPFDLVITDLGMAEMDGDTLSKNIKELTPKVPIILLTGWGTIINKGDYPSIDYLLKKPITMEELYKSINILFEGK